MITLSVELKDNFARFIKMEAWRRNQAESEVLADFIEKEYEGRLRQLYDQYQRGKISLGYLAKEMGLGRWEIEEELENRGLKVTNI